MKVTINGESREVGDDATVADVVAAVTPAPSGVAIALNGELVTRGQWGGAQVREADRIEVLSATAGG